MVFLIIVVHEFGHLITALLLKWKSGKITIYPFGGCCKFDEDINRPIKEELLILIAGPVTQILFCFFIKFLSLKGLMTPRNYLVFENYHYSLLMFNLLPVYPLDGGRIVNNIFYLLFPLKKSNKIIVVISFLIVIICLSIYNNLNFTMMGLMLLIEIVLYLKRQDYLYNRMLLERYLNNISFKKIKVIKNKNNMYRDKKHVIFYRNKYITEKDYLRERYR